MTASVSAIPLQDLSSTCQSLASASSPCCSDSDEDPDDKRIASSFPNKTSRRHAVAATVAAAVAKSQSHGTSPKRNQRLRKTVSEYHLRRSPSFYYLGSARGAHHHPSSPARRSQMLNVLESVLNLVTKANGLECRRNVPLEIKLDGPSNPCTQLVVDLAIVDAESPIDAPKVYFVVNCESSLEDLSIAMIAASRTLDHGDSDSGHKTSHRSYGATIFWKNQNSNPSSSIPSVESNYLFLPFDISVYSMPHASVRAHALEYSDMSIFDSLVKQNVDMSIREFQFPATYRTRAEFAALLVDTFDQAVAAIVRNL